MDDPTDNQPAQSPMDQTDRVSEKPMADVRGLSPIEHVRQRASMYIGSTDDRFGVFRLLLEVYFRYANLVLAGAFSCLEIVLHPDGSVSITGSQPNADRRDAWPITRPTSILAIAEDLNPPMAGIDYRMGDGLAGISICVVNFLSQWFEISIRRDGSVHHCRWERGIYQSPSPPLHLVDGDALTVHWMPDPEIFGDLHLDPSRVEKFLRKTGPLLREATCRFHDQVNDRQPVSYAFDDGLAHLVEYYNEPYSPVGTTVRSASKYEDANGDPVEIEFAVQFHEEPGITAISAANMHFTLGGGPHADGLWAGVQAALQEIDRRRYDGWTRPGHHYDPPPYNMQPNCSGPGFTAAVAVRLRHAVFEGSTHRYLRNAELQAEATRVVQTSLEEQVLRDKSLRWHLWYV
jgi:DNA gyrase/topoisomerase IV subunit B